MANSYENAYNYDRGKESHLIKNSEWGAILYLTHSKYGRNGTLVSKNYFSYTGGGYGEGTAYIENGNQSTTGNVYGIYDMSGNAYEHTATFNSAYSGEYCTGVDYINAKGGHFASTGGVSTEYVTAYSNSTTTYYKNFTVGDVSHTGDGIHEIYNGEEFGYTYAGAGWFQTLLNFISSDTLSFSRGTSRSRGGGGGPVETIFTSERLNRARW